jgi:hypothetical protein
MKIGAKLALIAISSVVLAGLSAVFIPMPYGAILATVIGIGAGIYMRSFFDVIHK